MPPETCLCHDAHESRIKRAEDDIQRVYTAIDQLKYTLAWIMGAGFSLITLVNLIFK